MPLSNLYNRIHLNVLCELILLCCYIMSKSRKLIILIIILKSHGKGIECKDYLLRSKSSDIQNISGEQLPLSNLKSDIIYSKAPFVNPLNIPLVFISIF